MEVEPIKEERAIFAGIDPAAEIAGDARAQADIASGRVVDHVEVAAWLAKWGTPHEAPAPPEWLT